MAADALPGGAVEDARIVGIPLPVQIVGHETDEVDSFCNGSKWEVVQILGMSRYGERQSPVRTNEMTFQE